MLKLVAMDFIKTVIKKHRLFLLIFLVAAILRIYRLDYLTTFGRDQGIDFLTIRDMIVFHKLTLIGIKVSLADFFQGPIYLYLLTPLFYILKLNPLAGAYTAIFISLLTLIFLYYIVYKMFNMRAAILAAIFFAVSPQLVMFGNTPLYQNFTPLFILLSIWCLYQSILINKKNTFKKYMFMFFTGLFIGIGLELHFLIISLVLTIFIYLVFFTNNFLKLFIFYFLGLLISVSPTIIFELKHNFLNFHLLINYFSGEQQNSLSLWSIWGERLSYFATHDYNFLIIVPLVLAIYLICTKNIQSEIFLFLKKISLINLIIIFIFALKLTSFGTHYLLPLLILFLIIISASLSLIKARMLVNIICIFFLAVNFLITYSQLNNNHGYFMPDGWSLRKVEQTSNIIIDSANTHPNFNVASLLDGDTRTYPVRYMLASANQPVADVAAYPQNDFLYVVGRNKQQVINSNVWEIVSLKPFKLEQEWQMGDGVNLYLLARVKDNPNNSGGKILSSSIKDLICLLYLNKYSFK